MNDKTSSAVRSASAVAFATDVLWLAQFALTWGLLIWAWNSWLAFVLVPLMGLQLAGLSELMHQAAHYNMFGRNRFLNRWVGSFAAAAVNVGLKDYREFHIPHHQTANSAADTEVAIYGDPAYVALRQGWTYLTAWEKVWRWTRLTVHMAGSMMLLGGKAPFVRCVRWGIPLAIAALGWYEGLGWLIPLKVIVAWYLPFACFAVVDLPLIQSEHYETPKVEGKGSRSMVHPDVQYAHTWNLKLPFIVSLILLRRNVHAIHHRNAGTHWSEAVDHSDVRSYPLGQYLKALWERGPRP